MGKRDKKIYGDITLDKINEKLKNFALGKNIELNIFQSNHEGEIIDAIQNFSEEANGIIINPGAFTHYSYAIRDALEDREVPSSKCIFLIYFYGKILDKNQLPQLYATGKLSVLATTVIF